VIVDTTLLVDLLRGDSAAREKVRKLEAAGTVLWVPTPAVFELWEGVERADRPEREREKVEEILDAYTVLAFENRHAARAGTLSGKLVRRGDMIDPIDAEIAGVAMEERLAVLTRNEKHFGRVPDLAIETY
jgi:predicted nucleic acid-binding protein